jgi:hypothetical protein
MVSLMPAPRQLILIYVNHFVINADLEYMTFLSMKDFLCVLKISRA